MAANNYEGGGAIDDSAYDQDPDASDNQQVLEHPGDQNYPVQPQMIGGADSYMGGPGKSGMVAPHQALRNTAQAILAYLHGDGAAQPQQVKQVEQSVDPQGAMDPNARTVAGIQAAAEQGGPDAGFSFIQAHRQSYNAKQAFARAALNGVQGKPPDLNAAVNAANQAYYHVPDGQSVQFATNGQGVTATVNGKHFQLSPQQFDQWLDVGGAGQFDKVYEGGAEKVLSSLASPQQPAAGGPPGAIEDPNDIRPFAAPNVAAQNPQKYRPTPAGYQAPAAPKSPYDDDVEQMAQRQFPRASQSGQKEQYLARTQEGRNTAESLGQRQLDVEKEKGNTQRDIWGKRTESNEKIADTRAHAYERNGDAKAEAAKFTAAVKMAIANGQLDSRAADRAQRVTTAKIMAGQVTPADEVQINNLYKAVGNAPQASVPQQGAAPAPKGGSTGKTFKLPDGRIVRAQ